MPDDAMHPSLENTLEEHHGCMRVVGQVEEHLARRPEPAADWLSGLIEHLLLLRNTLSEHFESEQDGALYREVPLKRPQLADRIQRLAAEHDKMLETIDELHRHGQELDEEPETYRLRELNGRVQLLVATIRRHEAEENEIIMNAYWSEMGVGD